MIGGQLRDLAGEGLALSLDEREAIHSAKTGAIIVASRTNGRAGGGALMRPKLAALERYGRSIGLAFQIMDDVLDVTSTTTAWGRRRDGMPCSARAPIPRCSASKGRAKRAAGLDRGRACDSLAEHGLLTQELSQVANFMVTRTS